MNKLPQYIVATKVIEYRVDWIIEDNGIDPDTVTVDELVELIEETIIQDFGYEQPYPEITYEYEGDNNNAKLGI